MKNKIFLGAALASFCALSFYLTSINNMENATLEIYGNKKAKLSSEKKFSNKESENTTGVSDLLIAKKSNSQLAKKINEVLATPTASVQVNAQDLNNHATFAKVYNNQQPQEVNNTMKLFVLLAYEKGLHDKSFSNKPIKVKSGDLTGNDPLLKAGMSYSTAYLKDLMIRQNNANAANILVDSIGKNKINEVARTFGTKNTTIDGKFGSNKVGKTTAEDLATVLQNLYQGKVLNSNIDNQILASLASFPNKGLANNINGTVYRISDSRSSVALVQTSGKTYVMSAVTSEDGLDFAKLGSEINTWFIKHQG